VIIDAFTHIIPSAYLEKLASLPDEAVKKRVAHCRGLIVERPHATDIARRLELLDRYGIDRQVVTLVHTIDCNVLPFAGRQQLEMARAINDSMAGLMENSGGKLVGIGAVPLSLLEAGGLKEMERAIKGLGLKGFAITSNSRGKPVDAPGYAPFWERAEQLGAPIFIHPANPQGKNDRPYEAEYNLTLVFGWPFETVLMLSRLVFSGIMERHPKLKVVSHHLGGGMIPFLFGRIEELYNEKAQEKVLGRKLTKPLKELFGLFYHDTAGGGSEAAIKCCYDVFGPDRIVMATDSPHGPEGGEPALRDYPRRVRECGIPKAAAEKIISGNAKMLLGIG
jgi:predicted TIM-barrel fold metal-dependent hydrolase